MAAKLIFLVFFVLAVGVFAFIKYAARGVKAGFDYVQEKDREVGNVSPAANLLSSNAPSAPRSSGVALDQRRRERLTQFEERLRQHGLGPTPFNPSQNNEQVCGAVAALFARLVNGKAIEPARSYSNHDLAVAWIGSVAVDMATQITGADFELAGMAMFTSLANLSGATSDTAGALGESVGDLMLTTIDLHNRIAAVGLAQETGAGIAKCFVDWAAGGGDAGIFAVRRMLPKIAASITAMAATS